ncbi:MAG: hybrid sensor histidine kinase/response regulator [Deltaproteobacteria bacterium]|nr:hybrid sensor histidine kinase/response regulator [Deltaproteobacteria bacterium]
MAVILIVERNKVTGDYVAATLARAGHQTLTTSTETEALAMFQERQPDVVLINYYLSEGNGLKLLETVKRMAPRSLTAVTTGLGSEDLARRAMSLGAFDYIVKGRKYFQDLPQIVEDLLARQAEREADLRKDRQKSRLAAQAELAGWIDHNFRNILSAVSGSLRLVDFQDPEQTQEKRQEYLSDGLASLDSAMKLLENLSRLNAEGSQEDERNVMVSAVVDEAWASVKDKLLSGAAEDFSVSPKVLNNLSFSNETRDLGPQKVVCQDLLTILEALLKNALEAVGQTPEPRIAVRAGRRDDHLWVSVVDNGRGMDERVKRHAFEPLFSTKGQVGVGLSLTTVLALVTRRLGEVAVQSSPGRGCQIEFSYRVGHL